jgi:hypothetical protein
MSDDYRKIIHDAIDAARARGLWGDDLLSALVSDPAACEAAMQVIIEDALDLWILRERRQPARNDQEEFAILCDVKPSDLLRRSSPSSPQHRRLSDG